MDWQSILAYVVVAIAALLALRAIVRAARGKSKLPPCPGCDAESCDAEHRQEKER